MAAPSVTASCWTALAKIRSGHLGAKPGVQGRGLCRGLSPGRDPDLDILTPPEAAAASTARPAVVVLQVLPYLDSLVARSP